MTKEIIKTAVVFLLLIIACVVVFTTRGNDKMEWNIDFSVDTEEEFSYDIAPNSANGEYKNTKGNNYYILLGQNDDGTYRIYFIHIGASGWVGSNKYPVVRLDNAVLDSKGSTTFTTENNVSLKLTLSERDINVTSNMSLGDAALEGHYTFQKPISKFSLSEVQMYK